MSGGFCQVVTFKLAEETYGIDILTVKEIIRLVNVTKLPNAREALEGIINLRGRVLPVVDLRKVFNAPPNGSDDSHNRIMVASLKGSLVGLIVDAVGEVLQIPADRLELPQNVLGENKSGAISGIYKRDDGEIIIHLDLEKVFRDGSLLSIDKSSIDFGEFPRNEGTVEGRRVELNSGLARVRSVDEVLREAVNISETDRAAWSEETRKLVRELVEVIRAMREGEFDVPTTGIDSVNLELFGEVGQLAKVIKQFRQDFKESLSPSMRQITSEKLPETTDHLQAVINTQEKATHRVLEFTETLTDRTEAVIQDLKDLEKVTESARKELDGPGRLKKAQMKGWIDAVSELKDGTIAKLRESGSILMDIMTEMGFQDLTGQKIKKTIQLINEIDERLKGIMVRFGVKLEMLKNPEVDEGKKRAEIADLLSQDGNMGGQAAIDELLSELGL